MTVKFLCKLFQRTQRRLDQDCIVKRCNYIRCLDGMKSISKRLWFKVAVQSMTGFTQHSPCWRKFKYATYKKVFVSNCRVYWMERMIDRKELSIVVLVWVWKILRMSVQILCKQFWRMKMREKVSMVTSKDATTKEELMVWKSDVTNFGSSLVYSQRLSWSKWKKKVFNQSTFFMEVLVYEWEISCTFTEA